MACYILLSIHSSFHSAVTCDLHETLITSACLQILSLTYYCFSHNSKLLNIVPKICMIKLHCYGQAHFSWFYTFPYLRQSYSWPALGNAVCCTHVWLSSVYSSFFTDSSPCSIYVVDLSLHAPFYWRLPLPLQTSTGNPCSTQGPSTLCYHCTLQSPCKLLIQLSAPLATSSLCNEMHSKTNLTKSLLWLLNSLC